MASTPGKTFVGMLRWMWPVPDEQLPQLQQHLAVFARYQARASLFVFTPLVLLLIAQGPWRPTPQAWLSLGLYLVGVSLMAWLSERQRLRGYPQHQVRWMAAQGAFHMLVLCLFPAITGQPLSASASYLHGLPWLVALLTPVRPSRVILYSLYLCGCYILSGVLQSTHLHMAPQLWVNTALIHSLAAGFLAQIQRHLWHQYAWRSERLSSADRLAQLGKRTAGICHELKGPLATGMQHLSIARELHQELRESLGHPEVTPSDLEEILMEADQALHHSDQSTTRMEHFLRSVEQHQRASQQEQERPFEVALRIGMALQVVEPRARELGVRLESDLPARRLHLRGDPLLFDRLLDSLLSNALEAIENHKVGTRVHVRLRQVERQLVLTVDDDGPGVPAELRERIFEPMFSTRDHQSAGLGLSTCRDIARGAFGGEVVLESSLRGARFAFYGRASSEASSQGSIS